MVEYTTNLDGLFSSLADPTRRDIFRRCLEASHTISSLALWYKMSFAAVAKHIAVLSNAKLIVKHKKGREQLISANIQKVHEVQTLLSSYEKLWMDRLDSLDDLLLKI